MLSSGRSALLYWKNRFGRDSYDNDGEEIEMYIMSAAQSGDGQGLRKLPAGTDPECGTTDPNYNDCGFVHTNSGIPMI